MASFYQVKSIETLFEQQKKYLVSQGSNLTNFNDGGRTRGIFMATAQILHQAQYDFLNGIRKAIPTAVFNGFEFSKLPGNKAVGNLDFFRDTVDVVDREVPIGTTAILDGINYTTIEVGTVLTGNLSSGNILSQATIEGTDANISTNAIDTTVGQGNFVNQPNGIDNVKNSTPFSGGTAEETNEARLERFRSYINGLARTTPEGIKAGALSVAGVLSATVVSRYPVPGTVTIFADDGTGILTAEVEAELKKTIDGDQDDIENYPGYLAAGIISNIQAPTIKSLNITLQIRILTTSTSEDSALEQIAFDAIFSYINTLTLGSDVILTEMVSKIKVANSDIYDVIVSDPTSNVAITQSEVARTETDGKVITVTSLRVGA